jgi:hypothetical protein
MRATRHHTRIRPRRLRAIICISLSRDSGPSILLYIYDIAASGQATTTPVVIYLSFQAFSVGCLARYGTGSALVLPVVWVLTYL